VADDVRCGVRLEGLVMETPRGDGVGCDLSPLWGGVGTSCARERRLSIARGIDGREPLADCVLATDASSRGYGWILHRLEKTENRDMGVWVATHDALAFAFRFEVTDERHIFVKELSIACAALSWAHAFGIPTSSVSGGQLWR
jgi:hypothetical protein